MRQQRSGFMLVLCLLILTLLLVSGMGLMSVQKYQHRAVSSDVLTLQALQLARSGLDDARIKLERDQFFPPTEATDQAVFTYSEDVSLPSGGVYVGSYFITIDRTWSAVPYQILRITSTSSVGPRSAPLAQRTLHAELDENPASPTFWHLINWQDDGSL
jgi:hypothetical protein